MDAYRPPESVLDVPLRADVSPIKAVLLGLLADVGGSMLVGIVAAAIYAAVLSERGVPEEQVMRELGTFAQTGWSYGLLTLLGLLCSMLGGYICARVARASRYTLGFVLALASIVSASLLIDATTTIGENALFVVGTLVATLLGFHLGMPGKAKMRETRG